MTEFTTFSEGDELQIPDSTTPPPPPPADPNLITEDIQSIIDMIRGEGGVQERFMSAADRLSAIATGQGDPALAFEEQRELAGGQEQFERRGLGFSAAAFNAAGRTRQGFAGRRLARRDAAGELELNTLSAGVETAALPAELRIAQLAAERAGQSGGGGTVICTVLHERGDLPDHIYQADGLYGTTVIPAGMLKWYQGWGTEVSAAMRSNRVLYVALRPFVRAWAYHMAFLMKCHPRGNWLGAMMLRAGHLGWRRELWRNYNPPRTVFEV